MSKTMYKIGADPELFLIDKDGKFRSAHDIIPGTKHSPSPVMNGAVQPDGVAAEFNIEPADTFEQFSENLKSVLWCLQDLINAKDPDLKLYVTPTAVFDDKYFAELPGEVRALGCEPDYDAYTGAPRSSPSTKESFRTGAGHIHIGWYDDGQLIEDPEVDSSHQFDCSEAVRQLDIALYIPSLMYDMDSKRRQLYGTIGSYRPKKYGVEYRPLSNAWVADPALHEWVFHSTQKAMQLLDEDIKLYNTQNSQDLVGAIRRNGIVGAEDVFDTYCWLVDDLKFPMIPEHYIEKFITTTLEGRASV